MSQVFYASMLDPFTWPNGAVGYRPGGSFDCLGPYSRVTNCPIHGSSLRLTCYASGYADTYFSVPASTRRKGTHVTGFFSIDHDDIVFHPHVKFQHLFKDDK